MTSIEDFAHKRKEAEALIRQHTPASLHDQLIALLRPAIALTASRADDADIPIGASKFGGAPDVPEGFVWPMWDERLLGLLAQINLEEVAPFDSENQLPTKGWLWFFASLDENNPVWGEPSQFQGWRVLFGHEPLHRVEPPINSHWITPVLTQRVTIGADWSLPNDFPDSFESADWSDEEAERWEDFTGWEASERLPYRMLTHPYAPQLSPFLFAANGSQGKTGDALRSEDVSTEGWQLLLQLNTITSEFFEGQDDLGWFYFMIRSDDLEKADFSRVWFNEQST